MNKIVEQSTTNFISWLSNWDENMVSVQLQHDGGCDDWDSFWLGP